MSKFVKLIGWCLLVFIFLGLSNLAVSPILAVDTNIKIDTNKVDFDEPLGQFFNPLKFDRPESLVLAIINLLLLVVGILSVIFIIFGGIRMVTSGGNEAAVVSGKKIITWAVLGLIVSILSFTIVAVVSSIIT